MTTRTPKKGQSAYATTRPVDPQQLLTDALNGAAMARWNLRRGNLEAAHRQAVKSMKAMQQLRVLRDAGGAE